MRVLGGLVFMGVLMLVSLNPARSSDAFVYEYDGSFEDAIFEVREAIVERGLTIDYVSHIGKMLARTKNDVGGKQDIFNNAKIFVFCSASISRRAMESNPFNIVHCPYNIFVIENIGVNKKVLIGHRDFPDGSMQEVELLLKGIARDVVGD